MRARRWVYSLLVVLALGLLALCYAKRDERSPWPCYIPGGCAFAQCLPWCGDPPIFTVRPKR